MLATLLNQSLALPEADRRLKIAIFRALLLSRVFILIIQACGVIKNLIKQRNLEFLIIIKKACLILTVTLKLTCYENFALIF